MGTTLVLGTIIISVVLFILTILPVIHGINNLSKSGSSKINKNMTAVIISFPSQQSSNIINFTAAGYFYKVRGTAEIVSPEKIKIKNITCSNDSLRLIFYEDQKLVEEKIKEMLNNKTNISYSQKELLSANSHGWTLAHSYARAGHRFDPDTEEEILKIADKSGTTVAHIQAYEGFVFDLTKHKHILQLANKEGKSVLDTQNEQILKKLIGVS